ncbi:MAG TPA: dioxygenase [Acetobacteraceae bacterium]|nr:dioxygenase [Acetobacteraceae bacterium]
MQDLTEETVTEAVLEQMASTPDPRLKEVMASLVRHMHDFAREVRLTPEEWLKAIGFLTQVGQMCTETRQEFILLSDVLGLSALVQQMHDAPVAAEGTQSSLLGPFYRQDAPEVPLGGSIARQATGPELLLYGTVRDSHGEPLAGAYIQLWQTDPDGLYDLQARDATIDMRGNIRCDDQGRYWVRTLKPRGYSIPMDGPVGTLVRRQNRHGHRPAHIHFLISAPGHRELVTALYFADDAHIDSDTVFGVSSQLVVHARANDPDAPVRGIPAVRYDFKLAAESSGGSGRVGADPKQLAA